MTWTKLSEEISNEYDQDPARFLAKSSSQRAYLGEGANIYRKIKQHPYLSLVKDKHLLNQQSWGGYSQSTLRAILYISEMEKYFSPWHIRSEEHTSELQSRLHLVCRLLLEKKKKINK